MTKIFTRLLLFVIAGYAKQSHGWSLLSFEICLGSLRLAMTFLLFGYLISLQRPLVYVHKLCILPHPFYLALGACHTKGRAVELAYISSQIGIVGNRYIHRRLVSFC